MQSPLARQPALVLHRARDLRLDRRPEPEPIGAQVQVEVRAAGVCGSDLEYVRDGAIGQNVVEEPLVLGHECAGVISACGPTATRHVVGDRVAVEPGQYCGRCRQCRAGRSNLCEDVHFLGTPGNDGAFRPRLTVHEDFAHPLPGQLSFEEGALLEPLSVALWACAKAGIGPGDHVVITGAGTIGQLATAVARLRGATEVTVTDLLPERLGSARRLGATATVRAADGSADLPLSRPADVLVECSGAVEALRAGLAGVRPSGAVVLVGMGATEVRLPLDVLQRKELRVFGSFRYVDTYPTAIRLVASGRLDLTSLPTRRIELRHGPEELLAACERGAASPKIMIAPGEDLRERRSADDPT